MFIIKLFSFFCKLHWRLVLALLSYDRRESPFHVLSVLNVPSGDTLALDVIEIHEYTSSLAYCGNIGSALFITPLIITLQCQSIKTHFPMCPTLLYIDSPFKLA